MAMSDRALGTVLLLCGTTAFVYYTVWTLLLPFFDAASPVHAVFPAREWAVRIPAFMLVLGISAIGLFLASAILTGARRNTS